MGSVTLEELEDGTYTTWVEYPPMPLDYSDGSRYEIPDYEGGGEYPTPEQALASALLIACADLGTLPDGEPVDIFDLIEPVGEMEPVECYECGSPATLHETRLELSVEINGKDRVLKLRGGSSIVCPECGDVLIEALLVQEKKRF